MKPLHKRYDTEEDLVNEICMRSRCSTTCAGEVDCEKIQEVLKEYKHLVKSEEDEHAEYVQGLLDERCRLQAEKEDLETRLAHATAANELLKSEVKQLKQKAAEVVPNICYMRPTCGI